MAFILVTRRFAWLLARICQHVGSAKGGIVIVLTEAAQRLLDRSSLIAVDDGTLA